MDSFTEKILARARERQRLLKSFSVEKQNLSQQEVASEQVQSSLSSPKIEKSELSSRERRTPIKAKHSSPAKESQLSESNEGKTVIFVRKNSKSSPFKKSGSPSGLSKTNTLNIQKENLSMEIKVTSSDNVRVEVEIDEDSSDKDNDHNDIVEKDVGLRKHVKDRLNKLGRLYGGGDDADISSPIHRTEEHFSVSNDNTDKNEGYKMKKTGKGLKKLANLAEEINRWEDDTKAVCPRSPVRDKLDKLNEVKSKKPNEDMKNQTVLNKDEPTKGESFKWDKAVLDSLESQGFQRRNTEAKLVFDYAGKENERTNKAGIQKDVNKELKEKQIPPTKSLQKVPMEPASKARVAHKTAQFELAQTKTVTPDPSLLSISERKALFEKNRGEALVPKAPFGSAIPINNGNKTRMPKCEAPIKQISNPSPVSSTSPSKQIKTCNGRQIDTTSKSTISTGTSSKCTTKSPGRKYTAPQPPISNSSRSPVKSTAPQADGIASTIANLLEKKNTISQSQIENDTRDQRKREMEMLLNRFNRNKEVQKTVIEEEEEPDESHISETTAMISRSQTHVPSAPPMERDSPPERRRSSGSKRHLVSPKVAAVLDEVKRIKVSPTKPGQLYPNLSDIEANTETENEVETQSSSPSNSSYESNWQEDSNTSFERDIMAAVCKNQTPSNEVINDESTGTDVSDVLDDMDEYLDEVLGYDEENGNMEPTPPKLMKSKDHSQTSHSFNYKGYSPNVSTQFKSPMKFVAPPKKSTELPTHIVDGEDMLPLTHTVSFYRKQTSNVQPSSPKKNQSGNNEEKLCYESNRDAILEKIKSLQNEVNKQQLIIAQTSQALNLCNSTLEFMGSTEQVEAEKVLLLATHHRQAILNEIQRLKVEGTLRPQSKHAEDLPLEKGTLTISNITLPLKKDYVRALAAAGGKGHHVTCLIKCGDKVVSSKLASTVASDIKNPCCELTIPGTVTLKDIYSDFAITFEVYCLQAQEEILPHEVKYHIKKSNKSTPKKSKHDSLLSRPIKESPAGPQVVRSPSFAQMGYVVFSIQQMNKKIWSLNNTPTMSPLEGSVEMVVSCELTSSVEYRGFLTMFEDISGFGAWHRRWCLLKGDSLSYWKYPDDEKKTPPIDSIDLKNCITKEVGPVSRDICARLHTLLLETVRDPLPQDKNTLVLCRKGGKTVVRHLLSADTKEERITWCAKLNSALTALNLWGNSLHKH